MPDIGLLGPSRPRSLSVLRADPSLAVDEAAQPGAAITSNAEAPVVERAAARAAAPEFAILRAPREPEVSIVVAAPVVSEPVPPVEVEQPVEVESRAEIAPPLPDPARHAAPASAM